MFASSNTLLSSNIFFNQEKDGVYFNNHDSFVTGDCSFDHHATVAPVHPINESGLQNSHNHNHHHHHHILNNNHLNNVSESLISSSRKRVAVSKKDRHSKILTAQGPRDRRVRLSIDISKKLFGLQDLLGFDKASKTLDWLFTKSKTAIKELVQEMKHTSSSTLSNQCEQVFMENSDFVDKIGKKKKVVAKCVTKKKKKTTLNQKSVFHFNNNVATRCQLRAEARTRARERTIEKLRIKKLENDVKNMLGTDHNHNYCYHLQSAQVQSLSNHQVKIGESFFEQKVQKPYSLIYNSQFKSSIH